jgi:tetratricopeptide (TPR) repeat protein
MRMRIFAGLMVAVWWSVGPIQALAGVHCSAETYAALPCQWSGFLNDWRTLRTIAVPDKTAGLAGSPVGSSERRRLYQQRVERLEDRRKQGQLSADEWADLGAYYLRLGEVHRAAEVLQQAYQRHPHHFAVVANLGTAWQRLGNLERSAALLEQAVSLAPPRWRRFEEYHWRLVQQRLKSNNAGQLMLDDLFGVHYGQLNGSYEPGRLPPEQRQRLPEDALAIVQQLVLWLPEDVALVWQLAELAAVYGDLKTAGLLFDWLVTAAAVTSPEVRARRQIVRQRLQEMANKPGSPAGHANHPPIAFRSRRALLGSQFDASSLPPVRGDDVNPLPWGLLLDTHLDQQLRPTFPQRLQDLNGHLVSITGFLQPLGEEIEGRLFMLLEYPVSCWYCEMPEPTGIVLVEIAEGKTAAWQPHLVKVVGRLRLNASDPEDFLFQIKNATITAPD